MTWTLACTLALLGAAPTAEGPLVAAGVAQADITPEFPVRLHGYAARKAEAKEVQQRLRAKALALGTDEQGASVLLTVDNLGVPDVVVEEVAKRLHRVVARERLAVASSHTHSAPCLTGVAPNIFGMKLPAEEQAHIDRYTRELTDTLERIARAALADRKPASLAWSQGKAEFAVNRRVIRAPGAVNFGEDQAGPVDHALPVLFVRSPEGKPRAVVVGYACHCTTLDPADNVLSADWAGYAQEGIEAAFPGAIALTVIGCGGDANPKDRTSLDAAKQHGAAIAAEVSRIFKEQSLTPLADAPAGRLTRIKLPFDTLPTRADLEKLAAAGGAPGYNASTQLARLDRGEPLQSELDYPVQTWAFGDDLLMVFLAGEVVVDYSLRLKAELDSKRLWVVAYANDLPCYIPSERILREGGYEGGGAMVYYARPTRLAPGIEDRIVSAVRGLSPPAFSSAKP